MEVSDFVRWGMRDSFWHYGVDTPSGFLDHVSDYVLGEDVDDITAATLVFDAEWETRGQAVELYDALQSPKTYHRFSVEEAAQFHVQPGATAILAQRVFAWLDETL